MVWDRAESRKRQRASQNNPIFLYTFIKNKLFPLVPKSSCDKIAAKLTGEEVRSDIIHVQFIDEQVFVLDKRRFTCIVEEYDVTFRAYFFGELERGGVAWQGIIEWGNDDSDPAAVFKGKIQYFPEGRDERAIRRV